MKTADAIALASVFVALVTISWSIRETLRVRRLENIRDLLGEKETVAFAAVQLMRGQPIGKARYEIVDQAATLLRRLPGVKGKDYSALFDAIICACVFESSDRARALLYNVIYKNLDVHDKAIRESFNRITKVFCETDRYGLAEIKTKTEFDLENGKVRLMWVRCVLDYHQRSTKSTTRELCDITMPGSFGRLSDEEFTALHQQKSREADPATAALLAGIATGQPVQVPLVEGQSARGLRTAISRAATSRGLTVETVEGDGFVAVRKAEKPPIRKSGQTASEPGKRRGRPPKRQQQDAAESASPRHLAAGES